jgi:hypothetical protein
LAGSHNNAKALTARPLGLSGYTLVYLLGVYPSHKRHVPAIRRWRFACRGPAHLIGVACAGKHATISHGLVAQGGAISGAFLAPLHQGVWVRPYARSAPFRGLAPSLRSGCYAAAAAAVVGWVVHLLVLRATILGRRVAPEGLGAAPPSAPRSVIVGLPRHYKACVCLLVALRAAWLILLLFQNPAQVGFQPPSRGC